MPLKLTAGRFHLLRSELPRTRDHFIRSCSQHARDWLAARIKNHQARMEVTTGVRVQIDFLGSPEIASTTVSANMD
ncbi:MAG: hypothetical protein KJ890_17810 [Gammaproteobacteria bacterium]|nr:hypothetical protein [Gammaproteobacteria bacterium]MBU0801615.1 hypothetical protein [Alphaproteobacteria bacterium]